MQEGMTSFETTEREKTKAIADRKTREAEVGEATFFANGYWLALPNESSPQEDGVRIVANTSEGSRKRYEANNHVLACVDGNGVTRITYITPTTEKFTEELQRLGYQNGGVTVPVSNGERFADSNLAMSWNTLKLGRKLE